MRLGRLTRAVLRRWHEWARTRLPPVLDAILSVFDALPANCQKILASAALEEAEAMNFDSPAISDMWYSDEGVTMLLAFLVVDEPLALAVDMAGEAVASGGLEVGNWINTATGQYTLTQYELETKIYEEAGLWPKSLQSTPPIDWPKIDRDIFQNCGLTPCQVDEMTLAELCAVLKSEEKCPTSQVDFRGQLYHQLSPKQLLRLALMQANN